MRTSHCRIMLRQTRSKFTSSNTKSSSRTSARIPSQRTITNDSRLSNQFQTIRTALAVEASSMRYAGYIMTQAEESLMRGWDLVEDEDGT